MSSNFNCSYMVRSSLTCILGFSVKFFFQPIYTDYANWAYFDKRSHLNLFLTILKGTHPRTIPTRFSVIWFSGFRREDLNVIFYQNMPNLHNRYRSAERKITQKNPLLLKIEISSIVHCCFSINQNELKF
jgi:hypothetical protein